MHAAVAAAIPFTLIPAYATEFELNHIMKTVSPSCLFVQPDLLPKALKAASTSSLPSNKVYVLEGMSPGRQSLGDLIKTVASRKVPQEPVRTVTKDTIAYFIFSSGTSGLPKGMCVIYFASSISRLNSFGQL